MISPADTSRAASGPAVLIVEDEWLLAIDLQHTVEDAGFRVVGPAHSVAAALELVETVGADGALLDVNLRNETSYPVAEALAARGIPFTFLSGYAANQLRQGFRECALLPKPVPMPALKSWLDRLTTG